MGKKKSVVLIVLATIVLAALLFMSVTPAIPIGGTPDRLESFLSTADLGTDLGGGFRTVYYPEGVISQPEYALIESQYAEAEAAGDTAGLEDPADYVRVGGVYLAAELCEDGAPTQEFQDDFAAALRGVKQRFENKGYAGYSVKVRDGYSIEVCIPYPEEVDGTQGETPGTVFDTFSYAGGLYFSGSAITDTKGLDAWTKDDVKGAGVADAGDSGYAVVLHFTSQGREKMAALTSQMVTDEQTTLYVYVGTNQALAIGGISAEMDESTLYVTGSFGTRAAAETVAALIDSVLDEENVFDLGLTYSQVYTFAPTLGEHAALAVAVSVGALFAVLLAVALILYKGMGLAHVYGFLTYILLFVLCIALLGGIVIDMAGVLAIVLSAAVMTSFNWYAFRNIRTEFSTGKTLTAAIKSGYKKSLALTIDAHIVLAAAALAVYLIATGPARIAGLIFLIGTLLSAACTLAVTRFFLYVFLAQPKNKIAFCSFRREEAEDED